MGKYCFFLMAILSCARIQAQTCGFSEGKNLQQLHNAVFERTNPQWMPHLQPPANGVPSKSELKDASSKRLSPVLLPKWSADNLPFFCKIEHDWGKNARLPLKFRLGSVEYVDWLEGKHP